MLHTHIAFLRKFYISGMLSGVFLAILSTLAIFPVANSFSGAEAAAVISETTLAMTTSDIDLPITVTDIAGTFATSDPASFTVTTNNYSGYTLNVHAKTDDEDYSKLLNGEYVLNSISSAASDETGFNAGNWGFKPSKVNSAANNDYLPAPTYEGTTLDTTAVANNNANSYTIELGAKVSYAQVAGKYSNTFVLVALANPIAYSISYSANTEDASVQGIPGTQSDEITTTAVELSSNVPTRTNYTFTNWCLGTVTNIVGADSCDGTVYAPGDTYDINQTSANIVTLKAMWTTTTPKAILGANGNLNFVYDDLLYKTGSTYTDNLGSTTVSTVYSVPVASDSSNRPAWTGTNKDGRTDITSVNFTQGFYTFAPTSTSNWFFYDKNISSITNANYLNTSSVVNMSNMFEYAGYNATSWNVNLSALNTANVENMSRMFYYTGYNATTWSLGDLSSWITSRVTDMSYMFRSAGKNAQTWDIGNINAWTVSEVRDMNTMFAQAGYSDSSWSMDLSSWNVSKVTNMNYMFQDTGNLVGDYSLKLNNWSLTSLRTAQYMFHNAAYNVTNSITLELNNWVFPSGTDLQYMFNYFGNKATTSINLDLSSWNVSNVSNMGSMFYDFACDATSSVTLDLSGWTFNTNNVSGFLQYAALRSNNFTLDASNWTINTDRSLYNNMLYYMGYSAKNIDIDCSGWYLPNIPNLNSFFIRLGENSQNGSISLNLEGLNAPNATSANDMISYVGRLTNSVTINISNWSTPKLESTKSMFAYTAERVKNSLTVQGVSSFDTSNVKDMERMFQGVLMGETGTTAVLNLDLSSLKVSKVTNMSSMFYGSGEYLASWSVGDLSSWNVSSVENMSSMFSAAGRSATSWSVGNISSWVVSSVTNMSSMFSRAGQNASYTLDLSSWSVPLVTNYAGFNSGVETKITPPIWNQ